MKENMIKNKEICKKVENTFDYLLRIPLRELNENKYDQLKEKIKEYKELLEKLKHITPEKMWSEDLDRFEKEYKKVFYVKFKDKESCFSKFFIKKG